MVLSALNVLTPVLFVIALGYAAGRRKEFNADQVTGINELALDFALPASLFVGMVGIPRAQLVQGASLCWWVVAALVGMYIVSFLVARGLRLSSAAAALFALEAAFPGPRFSGPPCLTDGLARAGARDRLGHDRRESPPGAGKHGGARGGAAHPAANA